MAIELRHLGVTVGKMSVVNDLNLQILPGDCWAVIGRNGVGKTTFLHVLAGLRQATRGQIVLDGRGLDQWSHRQRAQTISVLLQDSNEVFPLTVAESVASGRHPYRHRWNGLSTSDTVAIESALRSMDLFELRERSVQTLSGGERRRAAIAALVAQQTNYLLLDEPVNHLDLHYQIQVLEWLRQSVVADGKAAVTVMHDLNLAWRYCNKVIMLYGDGEVECGDISTLLDEERLRRVYSHPIARIEAMGEVMFIPKQMAGFLSRDQ